MYVVIEIEIIAHHAYVSILQCKNFTWFSKNAKVLLLTSLILDKKKRLQPSCQYFCSKVIFVQLSMKNYHSFKKKKSYFHFFFAAKDASLMHSLLFIINIYFHRKKVANSKRLSLFVSLQVSFMSFFCVHLLPDFVLQKDKARMKAARRRPSRRGAVVTEAYDSHHANWIRALRKKTAFNV